MLNFRTNKKPIGRQNRTKYLGLIRELAITDFKLKYQGSIIGYLWSLMKPLIIFGVLYLVFNVFVRIGASIPQYPLYLLLGVILWTYFAETTTISTRIIVAKGDLIRKIFFPRIVLVLSSSIAAFITLVLNLLVVFLFLFLNHINISLFEILLFILLILEFYLLSLALAFFLAPLFVKYRDIGHIWDVCLQVLFYATPIIYPLSIVPYKFLKLITLSPMTQIIQDARKVLITHSTNSVINYWKFPWVLIPYLLPIILFFIGYRFYNKSAGKFAEEV